MAFPTVLLLACPVLAQTYIFNRASFPTGQNPAAVAVADLDQDGKPDMVVANFADNTVSVLLGRGNGAFAAQSVYATGSSPGAIAVGDFNGDGKPDIAILNLNGKSLSVLIGNGDGTFRAHLDYSVGNHPTGIVASDFDGDKKVDLAVTNMDDSTVSVLYGNGDGSFQTAVPVTVGSAPLAVAAGDFNGDGRIDLITSNLGDATVTVLLSGTGRAFRRADFPSGILAEKNNSSIVVGDFNRDGKLDAIISDASHPLASSLSRLVLLGGNGDGTFASPTSIAQFSGTIGSPVITGDFNRDGILDLAVTVNGNVHIVPGQPSGTFGAPIVSPVGAVAQSIAAADLNLDGNTDLAVISPNFNAVNVSLGNGDGTFMKMATLALGATVYGPNSGVTADFNGDGKLDLAVAETNFPTGQISVRLGNGNGTFQPVQASPLTSSAINNGAILKAGDFNGDGKTDLLLMNDYYAGFQVLLGKGDGTFQAAVVTAINTTPTGFAVGDFNRDGKTDVVIATNGGGASPAVTLYLSKGDGTFQTGASYSVDFYSNVVVADLNQDGVPDLLLTSFGNPLRVFLGNGDGTFKGPISGPALNYSGTPCIGYFNVDRNPDVVIGTYNGMAFLPGNGDGTFGTVKYSNPSYQFGACIAADFNGDGELDILTPSPSNVTDQGVVLMAGNADGTFGPPLSYSGSGLPAGFIVGDFNADGRSDLAIPNQNLVTTASVVSLFLSSSSAPTPDFNVISSSGGNLVATMNSGSSATYSLQVMPYGGFTGTISFSCSGLPAGASCNVSPATVSGNSSVPFRVTVATGASSAALNGLPVSAKRGNSLLSSLAVCLLLGGIIVARPRKTHRTVFGIVLLTAALIGLIACGGGSASKPTTPGNTTTSAQAGTYNFVVSATSGIITHNTSLTLVVK